MNEYKKNLIEIIINMTPVYDVNALKDRTEEELTKIITQELNCGRQP